MRSKHYTFLSLIIAVSVCLASCKSKQGKEDAKKLEDTVNTYFSVKELGMDQFKYISGQPFTFTKKIVLNGKTDSSMVGIGDINWAEIFKIFYETDIRDKKFIGQYEASAFVEDITNTLNLYYEAKDSKLYTRKMNVAISSENHRILNIYIEAEKKSAFSSVNRKLFYIPRKLIQIQEFEKSFMMAPKNLLIEYRFM